MADAGRVGGQLHRPRLVVAAAVAQRDAGPGQPQVGGVVVGGAQRLRRAHDEPAARRAGTSVRSGSGEPGVDLVLALLFQHAASLAPNGAWAGRSRSRRDRRHSGRPVPAQQASCRSSSGSSTVRRRGGARCRRRRRSNAAGVVAHRQRRARRRSSARAVGSVTRTSASTRRSRLRCIRSAEPIQNSVVGAVAVAEPEHPGVLQEPAEDRADPDVLRQPRHARAAACRCRGRSGRRRRRPGWPGRARR